MLFLPKVLQRCIKNQVKTEILTNSENFKGKNLLKIATNRIKRLDFLGYSRRKGFKRLRKQFKWPRKPCRIQFRDVLIGTVSLRFLSLKALKSSRRISICEWSMPIFRRTSLITSSRLSLKWWIPSYSTPLSMKNLLYFAKKLK